MTGTEDRCAQGDANFRSTPPARFLGGAGIIALLAIIASFLPGVPAAQAQTPGSTRLEVVTVDRFGRAHHKWSDDNGASWSSWADLGAPLRDGGGFHLLTGTPAVVSDGIGRLNVIAESDIGYWQNTYSNGSWSGWFRLPGQLDTGALVSWKTTTSPALTLYQQAQPLLAGDPDALTCL